MADKSWTLTDVDNDVFVDKLNISAKDVGGEATDFEISKVTLRGGLRDGVDLIHVCNGPFCFDILPTRGMNLWRAWADDLKLGWNSPVRGPVHPSFVDMGEPSGLGWLDGFDELLAHCGLESNGAPDFDENGKLTYPLHGRIGNRPAHYVDVKVDDETGKISVTGIVEETRFHFTKLRMTSTIETNPGQLGLTIRDEIENFSASPKEIQMLYHWNFGDPLLDGGSSFVAPLKTVVPRNDHAASGIESWDSYDAPQSGFEEQVYFMELLSKEDGDTQALLKNAHSTQGMSLLFNSRTLPCFTVWKNTTAIADGYVTGIEPGTNFPNPRSYEGEQNRVIKLKPGGKVSFEVTLEAHTDAASVEAAEAAIAKIQGDTETKVYDKPQKNWCEGV